MAADLTPGTLGQPPFGKLAVSDCLRGRAVRWNGEHNATGWPRRTVAKLFTLVGICPEVGIGMGVPRAPIQLIDDGEHPRAVAVADPGLDYTAQLTGYARQVTPILDGVNGYIFAARSPSCGLAGVKVFTSRGGYHRIGRGVYAAAITAAYPTLPVVDAETLADPEVLLDFAVAVIGGATGVDDASLRDQLARLLNELNGQP